MRSPLRYLVLFIVSSLLLAGCAGKEQQSLWGVYQEPIEPKAYPEDSGVVELVQLWDISVGDGDSDGYSIMSPFHKDGSIFVADRYGNVHRINAEDGGTQWRVDLDRGLFSGVSVGDGVVVMAADNGELIAVSEEDGGVKWTTALNRPISAIPVVSNSRVVVRTADGLIVGVNSKSGRPVWRLEKPVPSLSVHGDSKPTVVRDAVLFGLSSGILVAANIINGREYWEAEIAYVQGTNELERLIDSDTPALVRGNVIFAAAYGSNVTALRIEGAETIWKTDLSTRLPMSANDNVLVFTTLLGGVVAVDVATGATQWEQNGFQGRGVSHPMIMNDRVVIGDAKGKLHTLDLATGELVQSRNAIDGAVLSIIPGEDKQFSVYSSEGNIAAFSL